MKINFSLIPVLLLILASCQPEEYHFNILFENQSDENICIGFDCSYPDDSLKVLEQIIDSDNYWNPVYFGEVFDISPYSKVNLSQTSCGKKLSWYYHFNIAESDYNGYISFTIMDKVVQSCGDVEKVKTEYDVLARYDLTKTDMECLGWRLTYPPSPELNGMHIWIKP